MTTKNYQDFCPGSLLEGRAEILVIFGRHFGRNDDLILIHSEFNWPLLTTIVYGSPTDDSSVMSNNVETGCIQGWRIAIPIGGSAEPGLTLGGQAQRADKFGKGHVVFQSNKADVIVENSRFAKI